MHESERPKTVIRKIKLMKSGPPNVTTFVLGQTGSGKTQLMADLIKEKPRWVIFDTGFEYDDKFMGANAIVDRPEDLLEMLTRLAQEGMNSKIIFNLSATNDVIFDEACEAIFKFQEANHDRLPPLTVVSDELNRFADSGNWGDYFETIIQTGRRVRIEKLFGAQWFGTIPTWVRDSITEIYAFRHTDDAGIDRLTKYGFFAEDIRTLPDHHALHYYKGQVEIAHVVGEK